MLMQFFHANFFFMLMKPILPNCRRLWTCSSPIDDVKPSDINNIDGPFTVYRHQLIDNLNNLKCKWDKYEPILCIMLVMSHFRLRYDHRNLLIRVRSMFR
jgi:hypothetical protein